MASPLKQWVLSDEMFISDAVMRVRARQQIATAGLEDNKKIFFFEGGTLTIV